MKKIKIILTVSTLSILSFTLTACGGGNSQRKAMDKAIESIEKSKQSQQEVDELQKQLDEVNRQIEELENE